MNNTNNSTGPNGHNLTNPSQVEMTGDGPGRIMVPDLINPLIKWSQNDKATLEATISLFTDFIMFTKYKEGEVTDNYCVHPAQVAAALAGIDLSSGLLPQNCLFWSKKDGFDRLGVYIPPQLRYVTLRNEARAWRVPMPGLIMIGHDYNYSLWAVKVAPTDLKVPLFLAPCPNIHPGGVCQGNAPFPRAGTTTMWQAVDVFFSSKFNRDLGNKKSKKFPENIVDGWEALHQADAETYPLDDLEPANLTLERVIHAV